MYKVTEVSPAAAMGSVEVFAWYCSVVAYFNLCVREILLSLKLLLLLDL